MTNRKQFEIYDVVKVVSTKPALQAIQGKRGIVRGKSQRDDLPSEFAYAVDIPALKENWFIFAEDLKATQQKATPNQVETDIIITVDEEKKIR